MYCLAPIAIMAALLIATLLGLRGLVRGGRSNEPAAVGIPDGQEVIQSLRELKEMNVSDLISDKEYEAKKADVLARI